MKLTFLGTSSALPTRTRNVTALALSFDQRKPWWLFDCGEGTQHQLLHTPLSPVWCERIFVSHLHGDHCFGLPGLLCTRAMQGALEPIDCYGPPGLKAYLDAVVEHTITGFPFDVRVHELTGPTTLDLGAHAVHVTLVDHGTAPHLTLAFVVDERPTPGALRVDEALALGVPGGPLLGRLKAGETVTLDDGTVVDGAALVDPPRPGRTLALVFDAQDASAVADLVETVDVLVHEATYLEATDRDKATRNNHSTAADAARLATRLGARALLLHHFSPRYESSTEGDHPAIADLAAEARAHFAGEVVAAHDLLEFPVAR